MKKVWLKLFVAFVLVSGISLLLLSVGNVWMLQRILQPQIEQTSVEVLAGRAAEIGEWVDGLVTQTLDFTRLDSVRSMDWERIKSELQSIMQVNTHRYDKILVAELDGFYWATNDKTGNIFDRGYFQEILGGKDFAVSNAVASKSTGKLQFVVAAGVKNDAGKLVSIVAVTPTLEILSQMASSVKILQTGYEWIVDQTGLLIAHPELERVGNLVITDADEAGYKGLSALGSQMIAGQSGKGVVKDPEGKELMVLFQPIPHTPGWVAGLSVETSQVFSAISDLILFFIISVVVILVLISIAAFVAGRSISKPIGKITQTMKSLEKGDLTSSVQLRTRTEIGQMSWALNDMAKGWKDMVQSIHEATQRLDVSSEGLSHASKTETQSMEQLSERFSLLDTQMQNASASVEEISSSIQEVSASAQQISTISSSLAQSVRQTDESAREGKTSIGEMVNMIQQARAQTRNTSEKSTQVVEQSEKVEDIVATITGISEQTNLLALNAAIEAARAGEAGKGFAVVADEIRKLAEESKTAAASISEILKKMRVLSKEADQATEQTNETVQELDSKAKKVQDQFASILGQVDSLLQTVENLSSTAEQQSASMEEMAGATDQTARSALEISQGTAQMVQIAQEQTRAAQEIQKAVGELHEISGDLSRQVQRFQL